MGGGEQRGFWILGDYGAGKSHALSLLRELSHDEGYASVWLTADGYESALNHPQRFLSALFGTMDTPAGGGGYALMLTNLLESEASRDAVAAAIQEELQGMSGLDAEVRWLLRFLQRQWAAGERSRMEHEWRLSTDQLVRLLCGETLSGLGAAETYRAASYRLLSLSCRIATIAGYNGLVIIVDEVESVYSKLASVLSRRGAQRVLSSLVLGLRGPNLRVALAITPDADRRLRQEMSDGLAFVRCLESEPIQEFGRLLLDNQMPRWRCRSLAAVEIMELLESIRTLYEEAYSVTERKVDPAWQWLVESVPHLRLPTRTLIRDTIAYWDRRRFGV